MSDNAPKPPDHRQRDAMSLIVIGAFFAVFAQLVLMGTFWESRSHAIVVNIASGAALLAVGVGMLVAGWRPRSP